MLSSHTLLEAATSPDRSLHCAHGAEGGSAKIRASGRRPRKLEDYYLRRWGRLRQPCPDGGFEMEVRWSWTDDLSCG